LVEHLRGGRRTRLLSSSSSDSSSGREVLSETMPRVRQMVMTMQSARRQHICLSYCWFTFWRLSWGRRAVGR
jgi:hypothetical protein